MTAIIPYRIAVPDEKLEKLHQKLKLTEFPDELEDAQWKYGVLLAEIKKLTNYWIEEYDWRKVERELNSLPHFQTQITVNGFDPLPMHFLHQKSEVKGAIPLLFVHGWPGSFFEGSKLLPLLQ
ncbi:alpha/beta-hydrolase [Penicillium canescens]|nr:alpha/beta-hydrolase [Penicillium canescens]